MNLYKGNYKNLVVLQLTHHLIYEKIITGINKKCIFIIYYIRCQLFYFLFGQVTKNYIIITQFSYIKCIYKYNVYAKNNKEKIIIDIVKNVDEKYDLYRETN